MVSGPGAQVGTPLSAKTLAELDPRVVIPRYDRARLGGGIVHIGVGGFHRAHQAFYLDELCSQGVADWSITGAGVLPGDRVMAEALYAQDCLYTLITRDAAATSVRVLGSIVDYVLATPDLEPLVDLIAQPSTRIVAMTITEGGYPVNEVATAFVGPDGPDLPPAFAAIALGLRRRRDRGLGGVTVQSCDNVMHNGAIARAATLGVAARIEPALHDWISRNVSFPNSMVDGITPATTDADRAYLRDELGLVDRWPVIAEPWKQWVLEDGFAFGRPPWEDAGALFTSDVTPYEILKLRLLNAGHSTLAYLAALAGHVHVHDVLADEPFRLFLQRFLDDEASPSLPAVPGIDVTAYKRSLTERFANPGVRDQVARLCLDGSGKFPKFLIPTIESQLQRGGPVRLAALALAGWCQYLLGTDDQGREIVIADDPGRELATTYAEASQDEPTAFLGYTQVFGARLRSDPAFAPTFAAALTSLRREGVYPTLDRWLRGILVPQHDPEARDGLRAGPMFQLERRQRIIDRVRLHGRVDVAELAEAFDVTGETIRRDLTNLQHERLVRRVHGGAVLWSGRTLVPRLEVREGIKIEEKRRIAAAAAAEVPEVGSLIIDSGSTALHLADLLDRERDLTVITNSIPIIRSLATTERPEVIVLGGALERKTMAFVDETGVDMLRDITVDVLFIGCDGMSPERGFTTPYRAEVAIKRAMMASARRIVMMFDHSKVRNDQLFRFATIEEVHTIITDTGVDDATASFLEQQGPIVIRV